MSFLLLSGALLTLQPVCPVQPESHFPVYIALKESVKRDDLGSSVGLLDPVSSNICSAAQGITLSSLLDYQTFFDRYVAPPAHRLIVPDLSHRFCFSQDTIRQRLSVWNYTRALNVFGDIHCSVSEDAFQAQEYAEAHAFSASSLVIEAKQPVVSDVQKPSETETPAQFAELTEEEKVLQTDDADIGSSIFSVMNATVPTSSEPPPKWRPVFSQKSHASHFLFPLTKSMYVTSPFGLRYHPILHSFIRHEGTDFRAPNNSEVMAIADGEVTETGYGPVTGFYVTLRHADGWSSRYLHLNQIGVSKNQYVYKGNVIGLSGDTGRANGPHLHLEVSHNNQMMDPMKLTYEQRYTSVPMGETPPPVENTAATPAAEPVDMTPTIAVVVGEGKDQQFGVRIGHKMEMYHLQEPIETEEGVWRIVNKFGKFKLRKVEDNKIKADTK
ncbi:M23 family metallopeptidase [Salmonella enterica subsp. salamae]|uniref:M23 family metallopeptidase n=1 Tax=Salmonella enterica subsp. salamae TaxID=59202 RepID=A0A5Y2RUT0_SALER|nr:M23 family metallopeptidase [Salmonella enterica subsp. salamae]ECJ2311076.1 M23 family metallopeptidase [Salmonella enterica subsp. salamae]